MNRNMYYSSVLGCNLGMFYKRRDYSRIVNGRNPIVAHEYLARALRQGRLYRRRHHRFRRVHAGHRLRAEDARCPQHLHLLHLPAVHRRSGEVRQGLQRRHHQGRSGHEPDLPQAGTAGARVYYDVDVSKYTAYFIAAINHDKSVSSIIDPMTKIRTLLDKHGIPMGGEQ